MRKALPAVFGVLCAALALGAILQAGAAVFLEKQLARRFPGAQVSVARCSLWPLPQVRVKAIDIRKAGVYRISIGAVRLRYSVMFLREPLVPVVQLDDVLCEIDTGRAKLSEALRLFFAPGSPTTGVSVGRVILERCAIALHTADLGCDARVSGVYDLSRKQLERADVLISSLRYGQLEAKDLRGSIDRRRQSGFVCSRVAYDKLGITDLAGSVVLEPGVLRLVQGTAKVLGGTVVFDGRLATESPWEYQAAAQLNRLDLAVLVNEFKWGEKLKASGSLEGVLQVNARPGSIGMLSGSLQVAQSGGRLSILDQKFLDYIASGSGQPVELLAESLRDYRYESGSLTVSSADKEVVLRAALSGAQGKRDLTVVIHRW